VIPHRVLRVLPLAHFHLQKKSLNLMLTRIIAFNRKKLIQTKELKNQTKIMWTLHLPLRHRILHLIQTLNRIIPRITHQKLFYKRNLFKKLNLPKTNPPKITIITVSLNFQKRNILTHNLQANLIIIITTIAIQHH